MPFGAVGLLGFLALRNTTKKPLIGKYLKNVGAGANIAPQLALVKVNSGLRHYEKTLYVQRPARVQKTLYVQRTAAGVPVVNNGTHDVSRTMYNSQDAHGIGIVRMTYSVQQPGWPPLYIMVRVRHAYHYILRPHSHTAYQPL